METMQEFVSSLKQGVVDVIPDDLKDRVTVQETATTKINDQKLVGLSFKLKGSESAPSFYVDQLYERHQDGEPIETLAADVTAEYLRTLPMKKCPVVAPDLSYENVKDHFAVKLLEIKRNASYLSELPYLEVGFGLALVCDIQFSDSEGDGVWRSTVNNKLMATHHYDKTEMFRQALRSAEHVAPPTLMGFGMKLFEMDESANLLNDDAPITDADRENIYVLSNQTGFYGAASLFYPGLQERIFNKFGEGYYALPSSLHEYLIMPESVGIDPQELAEMVKVANQTVVQEKDVLSDIALHYNGDTKQLEAITQTTNTNEQS